MDATYKRILKAINKKPQPQRKLARRTLIWVAYARRPLPIEGLAVAISTEMYMDSLEDLESLIPTEEFILNACANLISVDQGSGRYVRFVHFSVQEFFTSNRSITLSIGYEVAHREIAQTCMTYLVLSPKQNNPLAGLHQYALEEWPHHLLAGDLNSLPIDDKIVTLTLSFFEKCGCVLRWRPIYIKFSTPVLALILNLPERYAKSN